MNPTEKILIVVPCFNEAGRLPIPEFVRFSEAWPNYHFLFVNDGSSDATGKVLEEFVLGNPDRFFVLDLSVNGGKAEAVRRGMEFGRTLGSYSFYGFLDADLATPLSELPFMLDYSRFMGGEKRMIFGSRVKILGSHIERNPLRHYFGRISATGASVCLSLPVYDTQCGVKIFHHSVVEDVFREPFSSRWLFDVEIFFRFKAMLGKEDFYKSVLEVPVRTWNEIPGTKIRISDILKVPMELYRIYQRYAKHSRF